MGAKYTLLHPPNVRHNWKENTIVKWLFVVLLFVVNVLIGYVLKTVDTRLALPPAAESNAIGLSVINTTFEYRKDLADHPTSEADREWHEMFPKHGGYFRHPQVSPERATFSVYHQLHCLNSIRISYWRLYDIAQDGPPSNLDSLPLMQGPSHVRHCIDLIRQSLMCRPDLTVELKNDTLGGALGFGTMHSCLNWNELVAWSSKWENYQSSE